MRRRTSIAVLAALSAAPLAARAEVQAVLLEVHEGDTAAAARAHVEALVAAMGDDAPLASAALRRAIDARFSRSAGPSRLELEPGVLVARGRREFIEGNYARAIALLEQLRQHLLGAVGLLASDQGLRDALHQALLTLAHAYLRNKQPDAATERVSEVIRSYADRDLSLVRHSPELVRFFRGVRASMDRNKRGSLSVQTRPAGCMVFLNERFIGVSPVRAQNLYPGDYRVYVQRGQRRGRVHTAAVSGEAESLTIDAELDSHLQTDDFVGLRFASGGADAQQRLDYAGRVGRALHAPLVILVSLGEHEGRRTLDAEVIATATGRPIRAAQVDLQPAPPTRDTFAALGRFLLAGRRGPGIIVSRSGEEPGAAPADEGPGFFSARVFKWVSAAASAGALAAGITLIALDGTGTCDAAPGAACENVYRTMAPGIALAAGGGALAAAAIYLFVRDARRTRTPPLAAWIGPGQVGARVAFAF